MFHLVDFFLPKRPYNNMKICAFLSSKAALFVILILWYDFSKTISRNQELSNSMKRILSSLVIMVFFTTIAVSQTLPDEVIVSYTCANKPLTSVLNELTNRSKVNIVYSTKRLPKNKKITIQANDEQLGTILNVVLSKIGYRYKIVGNQLVIVRDDLEEVEDLITVSGYVQDSISGERLVYANIYLLDNTKGTETNEYGFFSFTLPKGNQRVYYSYLGYKQRAIDFRLKEDSTVIIDMTPDIQLNEIVILDANEVEADQNTSTESRMNYDELQSMASLGGEADVVRFANILPGVASGADGFGGLNVRGGSSDQNLVLFDGVPVYNAGHALGIFSIFNSNVVKSATLIKGGFPARYGGRLSSILDVRTREGSTKKMEGAVSISAIAMKASIEGPIGTNGSSYLFSGRRTFVDRWIKSITSYTYRTNGNDDVGFSNYYFYDLNGKLNFQLGKNHKLLISAYNGKDEFENEVDRIRRQGGLVERSESNFGWKNNLATIRLNSELSKKLFSKISIYTSDYDFNSYDYDRFENYDANSNPTAFNFEASSYLSRIADKGARFDFDYIPSPSHFIKFGAGLLQHNYKPGLANVNEEDDIITISEPLLKSDVESRIESPELVGDEYYGYIEDQISIGYGFMLNLGVHTSYISTDNTDYLNWQPRVALMLRGEALYFKASVSKMNQYLHLISNNGLGLPAEIWLPSTDRLKPQSSWIYSTTMAYHSEDGYHFGGEAFYKTFDDLSAFNEGAAIQISTGSAWENRIPLGNGNAYGLEFFLNKVAGKTTWMANYTYTKSTRQFDQLNNGEEYLHKFSLDHNIKLSLRQRLTSNAEFSLNYHISTGSRVTTPSGPVVPGPNGQPIIIYDERNNEVLQSYQRLDIGFNFYNKYKWGRQKISIGAYNVFDKRNPFYIDIRQSVSQPNKFELVRLTILPVFPAISYSLSF